MRKFFVIFVSLAVTFVAPMSTYALSESQLDKFAQDNILFYDPDQNTTACRSSNLSGDTIPEKVVSYLKGNNPTGFALSDNAVAGILANFKYESGFNPFRFEGDKIDGPGYGIAQFTPQSKITTKLSSDARTTNYFNAYYDIKYTTYDPDTGLPKESVPMEVVDAWLAVQMDFFFGASSEFENTKVGSYRNLGGTMGLDYIANDMTVHQAMDAAKSAEDAVRIFVWIMERPADKPGAASTRSEGVQKWVDLSKSYSSNTTGQAAAPSDGSDVTIIGDSITVGSEEEIKKLLPKADVHAQVSKQFYEGTSDNPGGIEILNDLKNNDKLRDVLVFALGTNSNGTTEEQMQKVVDLAGKDRKIIFVTNYTKTNDYIGNNNNFAKIKNDNNNVYIADWKVAVISDPNKYLSADGIHPSPDGAALFAETINKAVNGARGAIPTCDGVVEGGLTEKQAERLAAYYNGPETDAARWQLPYGKSNCVSFSKWFGEYTTGLMNGWGGNGVDLAHNFAVANHLSEGKEPRPFAIFSVSAGSVDCGGRPCGHTGVVVAVNGDDIMVVEANWNMTNGQINHYKRGYFVNTYYKNTFTYLDDKIDMQKLRDVVGN